MRKVAFLVDLGFFLPRYRSLIERGCNPPHSPRRVARGLFGTALRHLDRERGDDLYRILVYDCKPLGKRARNPIDGRSVDFTRTPTYQFRNELHRELVRLRKVALRMGELSDSARWVIRPEPLRRLLNRSITLDALTPTDVQYETSQKGVDIRLGIDMASLAYKRLVDRIVLIAGDADFVPAAKLARREGLDVVLDPLWNHVPPSLHEHIDGLKSVWPRPNSIADEPDLGSPPDLRAA